MSEAAVGSARRALGSLITSSLSHGTWLAYDRAWATWIKWCDSLSSGPGEEDMALLLFVGHCKDEGWSVSKIQRIMAGLAFGFKARGLCDFTKNFLVLQALKGWRRGQVVKDIRRPVSFQLLRELGDMLGSLCFSTFEVHLFRLAFSLAFFGALQLGELVSPSVSVVGGLLDDDVDLYPDRLVFLLRRSKTDQDGKGRRVVLYAVPGSSVCPVQCLSCFRSLIGTGVRPGRPLLVHLDVSFLSKFQFVSVFRKGIRALGLDESLYSGHSFRIGAATEAARFDLGDEVIKRIGRWESRRFKSYVRMDQV